MNLPVSDCHAASLEIAGRNATFWICKECGEPCDATANEWEAVA